MAERLRNSIPIAGQMVERLTNELDPSVLYDNKTIPKGAQKAVDQLEAYANSFLLLDPYNWMGIIDRTDEPRFPNAPIEVQLAIDKLSSLARYWSLYVEEWRNGRSGHNQSRSALEVSPEGTIDIIQKDGVAEIAKSHGRKDFVRYPGYILITNWLGDGDFWGNGKPNIFPMKMVVSGATHTGDAAWASVPRETFGIPYAVEEAAWNNWDQFLQKLTNLHNDVAISLLAAGHDGNLPLEARKAIEVMQKRGAEVSLHGLISQMFKINPRLTDEVFYQTTDIIKDAMLEKIKTEGEESPVLKHASAVATYLTGMVEMARNSQK